MSLKPIILFDMDGTLTPARENIAWSTVVKLKDLQKYADIGIVSGSPYSYIEQQMGLAWREINSLKPTDLLIMPCNGTQVYKFITSGAKPSFIQTHTSNMIDFLGKDVYRILISILTDLQNQVIEDYINMPLSGNFISFRGSMINWCMIGRDADHTMRTMFTELDIHTSVRTKLKQQLDSELSIAGIDNMTTTLGGSTSIDIYPSGWDKTYCLKHIDENRTVYFVGDKCQDGGNDRTLFEHKKTNAYETSGPQETLNIIDNIIAEIVNGRS